MTEGNQDNPLRDINLTELYLVEEIVKDNFSFARTFLKIIRNHGENALHLLGFLDQLSNAVSNEEANNTVAISSLPLISLPFHYATDSYYPNPEDITAVMLSEELSVRNDVLARVKDIPSKRKCFKVDTSMVKIPTLKKTDDNLYAWTTKFPDLFIIQTIDTYFSDLLLNPQGNKVVRNPKDRRVTEYLAYIPKESQAVMSGRAKLPPPSPYDQVPTLFRGKIYRN